VLHVSCAEHSIVHFFARHLTSLHELLSLHMTVQLSPAHLTVSHELTPSHVMVHESESLQSTVLHDDVPPQSKLQSIPDGHVTSSHEPCPLQWKTHFPSSSDPPAAPHASEPSPVAPSRRASAPPSASTLASPTVTRSSRPLSVPHPATAKRTTARPRMASS
jgi:hypothetical protein